MDYILYGVIVLIVITLINCYNGWKLGNKVNNTTAEDIANSINSFFEK